MERRWIGRGRLVRRWLPVLLVVAACGSPGVDAGAAEGNAPGRAELPEVSAEEFAEHVSDLSRPALVNVWASWCLPCRSEAPLLDEAFSEYGDEIEFIGVDVQDDRSDAREFLAEFGLGFDHFFDPEREIPIHYGGIGTPITFFFGPDGELVATHNGVVDERTLALNIDELLRME